MNPFPMVPCGYVLIAGPANTGKSSLFNRLTGAAISPVDATPFSTLHPITGIGETREGGQACFIDTPALEKVLELRDDFDMLILMVDARGYQRDLESPPVRELLEKYRSIPLLLALGHGDFVQDSLREPLASQVRLQVSAAGVVTVCPPLDEGTDKVLSLVEKHLPLRERLFPRGIRTLNSERFIAAEQIRTVILRILSRDVAETTAVQVEEFNRKSHGLYARVNLHVSDPADKGTVIGRKGQTLSRLQTESRELLEETMGVPVQLEAWVKVREGWIDDPKALLEFGYAL